MHHDIRAEIEGMHKIRGRRRAIDDKRDTALVGGIRDGLQVNDIQFRVPDKLGKHRLRLFVQLFADTFSSHFGNKASRDAERLQVMEQVDSAAKEPGARNHLVARVQNIQKRDSHRRHARRARHRADPLLERRDSSFKRIVRGVRDARIRKTRSLVVEHGFEFFG